MENSPEEGLKMKGAITALSLLLLITCAKNESAHLPPHIKQNESIQSYADLKGNSDSTESPRSVAIQYLEYMQYRQYDHMYDLCKHSLKARISKNKFIKDQQESGNIITITGYEIAGEEIIGKSAIVKIKIYYNLIAIGNPQTEFVAMHLYLEYGHWVAAGPNQYYN